jgi:hypothetical protein
MDAFQPILGLIVVLPIPMERQLLILMELKKVELQINILKTPLMPMKQQLFIVMVIDTFKILECMIIV